MHYIHRLSRTNEKSDKEDQSSSRTGHRSEVTTAEDETSVARQIGTVPILINARASIRSVAFLPNGRFIVSGGSDEKIRRWRIDDGREVGTPMETESEAVNIAVSLDGEWIVVGTANGLVQVWNAETRVKVKQWQGHRNYVRAVDVSPDGTRVASGSSDQTACIWSRSTGERLLGPWEHDYSVVGAKFSPDGRHIATATWERKSVRVYDSKDGHLLFDVGIEVSSYLNGSLAWSSDCKRLFVLSRNGVIHRLDTSTGNTLSQWPIHTDEKVTCIALLNGDAFIAASANSRLSFWNTSTQKQVGWVTGYRHTISSMAISKDSNLVASGSVFISLRNIHYMLPLSVPPDNDAELVETVRELRTQIADFRQARQQSDVATQSRAQGKTSGDNIAAEETIQNLRNEPAKSQRAAREQHETIKSLESDLRSYIVRLDKANQELREELANSQRGVDEQNETIESLRLQLSTQEIGANNELTRLQQIIRAHEQKYQCESLYAKGHISEAAKVVRELSYTVKKDPNGNQALFEWLTEFTQKCTKSLEQVGDEAFDAEKWDESVAAYALVLSLTHLASRILLKWTRTFLIDHSVDAALSAAAEFEAPRFDIYSAICDALESRGRVIEAIEYFQQMKNEVPDDMDTHEERSKWELEFRARCINRLVAAAKDPTQHETDIGCNSKAPSLDRVGDLLLKCSNEFIELFPSSHKGYEGRHAALHHMGRYKEAFEAFSMMLTKIEQSPDSHIRKLRDHYVDATSIVRREVQEAIRDMPSVLIDTDTGHLYDKAWQAAAFEGAPIYDKLLSTMTTSLSRSRISKEVKEFYRYVMFSHKWQPGEPTFQQVENVSVYKLPLSPTFQKLQNFCKLVVALRFKWAWSDTCCVNQLDKSVQQESIIAMFRWYRNSSLTIVHLLGVLSESQEIGCLWKSIWNTRGWTYQEYVASEVVQFYTEDWKPYLGLQLFNHKESLVVLSEMEQATKFTTKDLTSLRPGLDRVREKLYLASRRQTTREEDVAYSLFGIFKAALPVMYGEGNQAIGRLLEHILTRSGDVTLLAWTGDPGSEHSYLPASLAVYDRIAPPHILSPVETAEMDNMVTISHCTIPNQSLPLALYDHLYNLPALSLVAGRLRLPGVVFPLTDLLRLPEPSESDDPVYRATTPMLGQVEIKTTDDLSGLEGLVLIHPWIGPLLDQDFSSATARFDHSTRAMRLVVRLKQPFGALLLAPFARAQYRRVATDSLIMVRVRDEVTLDDLMDGIGTVDIQ